MDVGDAVALSFVGRLRSDAIALPVEDAGPPRKRARDEAPPAPPAPAPDDAMPTAEGNMPPPESRPAGNGGGRVQKETARFDVRCQRCLKIGHKAKDCAEGTASSARCYKCGEDGHQARQCKVKGSLDQFGPRRHEAKRIVLRASVNRARTHDALDAQLAAYGGGASAAVEAQPPQSS